MKLEDTFNNQLQVKLDIGVQNNLDIMQDKYLFNFESLNDSLMLQINTKEQIFVEKLKSLLLHGIKSTRYKDVFDIYYFIIDMKMSRTQIKYLTEQYIFNELANINNYIQISEELILIFNNNIFNKMLYDSRYNWLNEEVEIVIKSIIEYINSI